MTAPTFRIDRTDRDGSVRLAFSGRFESTALAPLWSELRTEMLASGGPFVFDLTAATAMDGGSMALLLGLKVELESARLRVEVVGASGGVARLLAILGNAPPKPTLKGPPGRIGILDQIGQFAALLGSRFVENLTYIGDVTASAARAIVKPSTFNGRDLGRLVERTGADGLPIVLLINLLVGVTLGIQGAIQLEQYGGNIYIADLVGIVVTRSIGPLMTAIIVAGRSGAAFAAELGTMKVSEEVDAIRTIGLDPVGFLVLPRVLALCIAVPLLALFADVAGVFGGMIVGITSLDLSPDNYLDRTRIALELRHVGTGLVKSLFFGLAIAVIACRRGLATQGGAEGVGRSTTSAVVTIIFWVVVLEAIFTSLFQVFGV
ncbi:MAG: MlaE family lipid ABC transporter permease subunit [Planctomycetes bacterium]|nr:MlaE family lipid ABC transporter permease subunit [Planctomycetota bacterium]MCC7170203.1 MlaE family lipid ABC transporter permease subunit [Planctomycetota bacterium]